MNKKNLILIGFILLKFLLQYNLVSPEYDLHRDEYLHLDQADHLAWGFQSVPPFTSWTAYIIKLLGNDVFWVRFFPALFGALTLLVVWKTIISLKGNLFALILASTGILFSALLRMNMLFQPNSFDILCWTTFYFIIVKYCTSENKKWLFIGGFVFAVAFLNKYNFIFLLIGIFPAILLTAQRRVFAKKEFYFAIGLGLLLITPNLLWQYNNAFPVFHHLKELEKTQLVNVNRLDFFKAQILFFIGSIFVILFALYALLFYPPFKKYKVFFWSMLFTLAIFSYFRAKDYYAVGIYPVYIAFGSVYLGGILNSGWKRYLQPVAIAIPILLFIPISRIAFPNKSPQYIKEHSQPYKKFGLLHWEDGKDHEMPQDFADMLGWKELAAKVDKVYESLPNQDQTIILCDNYGQTGAINYYSKNKKIKAVSFNADYINWFQLDRKIVNFIRIKEFEGSQEELKETSPFFENSKLADSITNTLAREYKTRIFVFSKPKIDINKRLKSEVGNMTNFKSHNE
jgi:hypothetical protein